MGKETGVIIGNALKNISLIEPLPSGVYTHYKLSVKRYYWCVPGR